MKIWDLADPHPHRQHGAASETNTMRSHAALNLSYLGFHEWSTNGSLVS